MIEGTHKKSHLLKERFGKFYNQWWNHNPKHLGNHNLLIVFRDHKVEITKVCISRGCCKGCISYICEILVKCLGQSKHYLSVSCCYYCPHHQCHRCHLSHHHWKRLSLVYGHTSILWPKRPLPSGCSLATTHSSVLRLTLSRLLPYRFCKFLKVC